MPADLYPLGPTEEAIWSRAGGDTARLDLKGSGRVIWRRAVRAARLGSEVSLAALLRDFPHHRELAALVDVARRALAQADAGRVLGTRASPTSARPMVLRGIASYVQSDLTRGGANPENEPLLRGLGLAGTPATVVPGPSSPMTTAPAAAALPSTMTTSPSMITPAPTVTPLQRRE